MNKHTPGPWFIDPNSNLDVRCATGDVAICIAKEMGGVELVLVSDTIAPELRTDAIANARLMAAAPDLLAAAYETVSALIDEHSLMVADDDYIYDELGSSLSAAFFSARDAISKATGDTPA